MVQLSNNAQPISSDLIFARTPDTQSAAGATASSAGASSATESFANQLASQIEGYLSQSGNGSQFEIDVQNGQGQNGASEFTVTVKNLTNSGTTTSGSGTTTSGSGSSTSSASASIAGAAGSTAASKGSAANANALLSASGTTGSTSGTTGTGATTLTAAQLAQMTPDEAYWAEQPEAVQALQNMPMEDRGAAAQALAEQGYTIDVPIMVWGQDPLTTMMMRQQDGYTWVPSAMQANIQLPPGVSMPGLQNYDATNPPPGSIQVTTAFANGTNGQDPWVQWPPASTSNS